MSSQASFLPAIATIVAAVIAAAISFINMTMTKEMKTSEFRQSWIDALREDIATFLSCARMFARALEECDSFDSLFADDKIKNVRQEATERFYKIKLRLNLNEDAHQKFLDLLQSLITEQNQNITQGSRDPQKIFELLDEITTKAATLLKFEWQRVKKGEWPFRIARNWIAPIVFILGIIAAIYMLSTSHFGPELKFILI